MKLYFSFFLLLVFYISSCSSNQRVGLKDHLKKSFSENNIKKLNTNAIDNWQFKDVFKDSIPGISLFKIGAKDLASKKKEIVIAVIDMAIQINHEALRNNIWKNLDEIPNNKKDDDNNGYVDDINGWNFLGNKNGTSTEFVNYEYTRIINKYSNIFENSHEEKLKGEEKDLYKTYLKAKKKYNERNQYAQERFENDSVVYDYYIVLQKKIDSIFSNKEFNRPQLDSILQIHKGTEPFEMYIQDFMNMEEYGIKLSDLEEERFKSQERLKKLLNISFNDRELIGDNEDNLADSNYGNSVVDNNTIRMDHGTSVAGVISGVEKALNFDDDSNYLKIMPVVISGYGDENDKDLALAIYYAVDNGASIINISSGKSFSLHENWIKDAIKYAEKKDVLIIHSAGNDNLNLDNPEAKTYPDDASNNGKEFSYNFLTVGASSYKIEQLKLSSSNYGKESVDIFAPGENIQTADSQNGKYKYVSGTSFAAALVSGVSGLLRSYYPNLSAKQIKEIIMSSIMHYNGLIEVENSTKEVVKLSFDQLSKSGGILNFEKAFLQAQLLSQKKLN
ncbi:S8 family serine peptidase [Cellulophaga baltica]|uniref:Subtilase family protein n=1 Tax=Cellulophaga baltica TaxID=76594 RepID=A0A1G7JMN4_9FLAO|nr:S8 family serine peptidase [Cellulophaga baltica]SDF26151.1 Subtilase family protein [Cellulophaga baltica]